MKRNLVSGLDTKMWEDIIALHVAASYLDPSLKGFSFVRDAEERCSLSEQAAVIAEENATYDCSSTGLSTKHFLFLLTQSKTLILVLIYLTTYRSVPGVHFLFY